MNMPSGLKPPSGAMPGGSPPNGASNGMASPMPSPGSSTSTSSSSTDMSETSLIGSSGGAQTNGLSSSPQSMSGLGNSLYNYVGSIMPTIQPLFKI
jgi:hypothetical protein